MGKTAKKTDPKLWERVKDEVTQGDKGGHPGQWSARKAQMAVQEYKKEGGGYAGEKSEDNSLTEWSKEDWGTGSGKKSTETGERYLPKKAREALSPEDYRRTTSKKRKDTEKGQQFSRQPEDIQLKTAAFRQHGSSKEALLQRARELGIKGRSRMTEAELSHAVGEAGR